MRNFMVRIIHYNKQTDCKIYLIEYIIQLQNMCDSGILIEMNAMNAIPSNRHYSE